MSTYLGATFELLRDAQQILHQLHLQQSEETRNVNKRIQTPEKRKAGLSLLLYKGRLLKARRAKLLTTSNLFQKLYNEASSCSKKTQLSEEVGIPAKQQLEIVFANGNDGTSIISCPPESIEILPKEISTVPACQSFCYTNGPMSVNNVHMVEVPAGSITLQATGNQNFECVVEPQIHTDLEIISMDNYPKRLENSAVSVIEGNCRYPCFGKPLSIHSMDHQLQTKLPSSLYPFQTVSVPLAIHQSQSMPCVVPQQQQQLVCMATTENVAPPRGSLWPFGALQQWHAGVMDTDLANVPSTELAKCEQHENSENSSEIEEAATPERRNFVGNASFKRLYDDGHVRPGMNVLTVRSMVSSNIN